MKLDLAILKASCNVAEMLAHEEANRALSSLCLDEADEIVLNRLVNDLTQQAHVDAKKSGFTRSSRGKLPRPTEVFDPESPIDWSTSAKGTMRSEEFAGKLEALAQFVDKHLPETLFPGQKERILKRIQNAVSSLVRIIEERGYEEGYKQAGRTTM